MLDAGPAAVSALASAGVAAGALLAIPLGPWVEFRHKRPVMIGMDLVRCAAFLSVPVALWLGWLTFAQLVVVSVVAAACGIAFRAASGSYLKALVAREELLRANARFESTTWTAATSNRGGSSSTSPSPAEGSGGSSGQGQTAGSATP